MMWNAIELFGKYKNQHGKVEKKSQPGQEYIEE